MKFKNIKLKAHITVFITLVLIIISGLLFTLIHSAIYTSLQFSFNMACRMALEGTFAGFNNEVFEKYGIYILKDDGSEDVIKRIFILRITMGNIFIIRHWTICHMKELVKK